MDKFLGKKHEKSKKKKHQKKRKGSNLLEWSTKKFVDALDDEMQEAGGEDSKKGESTVAAVKMIAAAVGTKLGFKVVLLLSLDHYQRNCIMVSLAGPGTIFVTLIIHIS